MSIVVEVAGNFAIWNEEKPNILYLMLETGNPYLLFEAATTTTGLPSGRFALKSV
jgi:hypothetical protein